MSLFKRGYKAIEEEKKRVEEYAKNKAGIYRLFVKEGEAPIVFLTEEPVNFYEHSVKETRNGKAYYDNVVCVGNNCPHCDNGDRASFKSAWLVLDLRPREYEDKDGNKKKIKRELKLYVVGTKTAGIIQRKCNRYGLIHTKYYLERIGKGTDTTYNLEKDDDYSIREEDIAELLPKEYQEEYDGSEDSLMAIIEKEILKTAKKSGAKVDVDEEEDDDEEDNDAIIGVDDEEEEKPKSSKKSTKKFSFKRK